MTNHIRRQLTLFVEQKDAEIIEQIRQQFNPRQFELIKSHVTLCREEEIQNLEQVIANLTHLAETGFFIGFGKAVRFDRGKGVLLPAIGDNIEFYALRRQILAGLNNHIRKHEPHLTLMHPRNSVCTDEIFETISKYSLPGKLHFAKISLIEQTPGEKWEVLEEYNFNTKNQNDAGNTREAAN